MSKLTRIWMTVAALTAGASAVQADVWDVNTQNDNSPTSTENELMHGSDQLHDLAGTADLDHYRLGQRPCSSWEVVVDSTSADLNSASASIALQRLSSAGTSVLQTSEPITISLNFNQSLRWQNSTTNAINDQVIKVFASACSTAACGLDDVYRIRAFETTYAVSRFNNAGGQVSVVIVQNTAPYAISGTMFFWGDAGNLITSHAFTIQPKALFFGNTSTVSGIAGQSGAVTLTHTGRYSVLAGKAVSLEPSSGFSFDTLMVHRAK